MSTTEATIRARIQAYKDAGLPKAAEEEEAKLAQPRGLPGPDWLIEDWFPTGHKGQITAPEGSFKTIWMACLSVHIASGRPIFGCRVQQGPVLVLDEETPPSSLERQLGRFSQGLGYSSHKELPIITRSMGGFRFGRKTRRNELLAAIEQIHPILITMDSFIAMLPGGRQGFVENDSGTGEIVRDDLNRILSAAPLCSTLLATHSKKPVSELTIDELKLADMQSLVRGHGSIVGEGCDTGYVLKKISEYPEPTRFAVITKVRRHPIPMSHKVVYVEMEEEEYGKGWARLKEISQDRIPPAEYAKELYELYADGETHSSRDLTRVYALLTKGQIRIGVEELLNHKVIIQTHEPQVYVLNPKREGECNEEYLSALENSDKEPL